MPNIIYGHQIDPDQRVAAHLADLQGIKHLARRAPLAPRPGEPIILTVTTSGPIPFAEIRCWYAADEGLSSSLTLHPSSVAWDQPSWDYVRLWQGEIPGQPEGAILRYRLAGRVSGTDRWIYAENQSEDPSAATDFAVYVGGSAPPAWSQRAIIYHIYLDRFYPGDGRAWNPAARLGNFFGGTLLGVLDQLDYLQDLGANTIWLSPLFASPTDHGYDATDLFTVEPRLGTNADLQTLLQQAHARDIRVLLDFVPNHWSNQHPTFVEAQRDPASPYRAWYLWRNWPDDYETFFDVQTMPKLNLRHGSPARAHLLDAARYWLEQGVDGYRLDHADGPAPDFWADFRRACQQTNPDCWLFGEVVKPPPVQRAFFGNLHGQLDFALARALRETFALCRWRLTQFDAFLAAHEAYFPPAFSRPAFLDNHDMNRFLFLAGDDKNRLKLAALVLFTLSGPPVLYYGTETGLSQEKSIHDGLGFDEARLPMRWGDEQDHALRDYFRTLAHLRRAHPVLLDGERQTLRADPEGVYAYARGTGPEAVLIALNTGPEPRPLTLPFSLPSTARDRLNGCPLTIHPDRIEIHLPPETGAFVC